MNSTVRVRFAPSPTGPLHIGGVRTALYTFLYARKHQGTFILRIEDTDQGRYVPGAEDYIKEALDWLNIQPDEGPEIGGDLGPYRQSERKAIYKKYADEIIAKGNAYFAFDTPEDLGALRKEAEANKENFKYDASTRMSLKNSLSLSPDEVQNLMDQEAPYVIRLKVNPNEEVVFQDLVREEVRWSTNELDDKVLMKADGMPTYHFANIVDDHLMKVSHVIRGEEWLSSTPVHVLLYRAMGWEDTMPEFCHLPLILKPVGKGKLSKRDGAKFGFPVFPLDWVDPKTGEEVTGFREKGFEAEALLNFLALVGWNPGDNEEVMDINTMIEKFSIDRVSKSGGRFDYDKAKWFNAQYVQQGDEEDLATKLKPLAAQKGYEVSDDFLKGFVQLMKTRVTFVNEFLDEGYYFFEEVKAYDEKNLRKKWKEDKRAKFDLLYQRLDRINNFTEEVVETEVKAFLQEEELGFGAVLPILRIGLSGTLKGPSVFGMMELLGKEKTLNRLKKAYADFDKLLQNV